MNISEEKMGMTTVLRAEGRLDAESAQEAEKKFNETLEGGAERIVMDLSAMEYISSAGIRVLLDAAKRLQKKNGKLLLAAPVPQVRKVLEMIGVSNFMPFFDSVSEAVRSCA